MPQAADSSEATKTQFFYFDEYRTIFKNQEKIHPGIPVTLLVNFF
jgi:hypothetical protein